MKFKFLLSLLLLVAFLNEMVISRHLRSYSTLLSKRRKFLMRSYCNLPNKTLCNSYYRSRGCKWNSDARLCMVGWDGIDTFNAYWKKEDEKKLAWRGKERDYNKLCRFRNYDGCMEKYPDCIWSMRECRPRNHFSAHNLPDLTFEYNDWIKKYIRSKGRKSSTIIKKTKYSSDEDYIDSSNISYASNFDKEGENKPKKKKKKTKWAYCFGPCKDFEN